MIQFARKQFDEILVQTEPIVRRAQKQKDDEIRKKEDEIQSLLTGLMATEEERLEAAKASQKSEMTELLRKCQDALKMVKEEKEIALQQKALQVDILNSEH